MSRAPNLVKVDDNMKAYHDMKTTQATIKTLLAGGTPDWVKHPQDYKAYANESYLAEKEISDSQVKSYKMGHQDILTNFKARNVNIMSSRQFVKTLRDNGFPCFTMDNGLAGTVGLWHIVPTPHGLQARYSAFLQIPAMIEWSVLAVDNHGLPAGESYRGWRTVLSEMIKKDIITEQRAHEIFGKPTDSIVSRLYRESLWTVRHSRPQIQTF